MNVSSTPRRSLVVGMLAVVGSVLCFAISFSIIKWPGIPGSVIAWWRLIGSAVLWWVLLVGRRLRTGAALPDARTWRLTVPAALCFGVNVSLLFLGMTKTSVAHGEFINAMAPVVLIPAGMVMFGEHPNWKALRWAILSLVGLVIVLTNGPSRGVASVEGDVLVAISVIAFCGYQLLARRARVRGVSPWDFMTVAMTAAVVTATPVALVSAGDEIWPLSVKAWAAVAMLSVLTGMAGHGMLYYAQHHVPISTISIIQAGQPSLSAVFAWVLLGEALVAAQVPGMLLVTLGLVLVFWFSLRPASVPPAVARSMHDQPPPDRSSSPSGADCTSRWYPGGVRIMVTNDDGIDSIGLHVLARALTEIGEVVVVAPDREFSGSGASVGALYEFRPEVRRCTVDGIGEAWSLNGPPALCVLYSKLGVFGDPFDLVVSGINPGSNVGRSVYYSGTVGACLAARNGGVSGVAVSQAVTGWGIEGQGWIDIVQNQKWHVAAEVARVFVAGLVADPPASPVVVNLNVPNLELDEIAGWEISEVGAEPPRSMAIGQLVATDDPDTFGVQLTWGDPVDLPAHTDGGAVERDLVAVTYLSRITAEQRRDLTKPEAALANLLG